MSKLHLVLVFATAHFLPVGISTPNLTRAAAVLVLFILFYFFPLIFLAFHKMITIWQETQARYERQGKQHDWHFCLLDNFLWRESFAIIANNTCNVLLSLSICRENCPKIIFTFFYLNRNDPLREVFCGGEQLERRCEEKYQQRAHPSCSQPFQKIFMSSEKSPQVMDGERWPCMRIPHHPRNILLCPVKCNIKKGNVAYWQNTQTCDFCSKHNKKIIWGFKIEILDCAHAPLALSPKTQLPLNSLNPTTSITKSLITSELLTLSLNHTH